MRLTKRITRLMVRFGYRVLNEKVVAVAQQLVGIDMGTLNGGSGEEFVVKSIISPNLSNKTALDIGANTGLYSSMMANYINIDSIISFEPNPNCIAKFKELNKNRIYNVALGDRTSEMPFYVNQEKPTSHHASLVKPSTLNQTESLNTILVDVKRLDELIENNDFQLPGFIKIDAEGYDLTVIKGLGKYLNEIDFIQFEFNAMHIDSRTFLRDYYLLLSQFDLYRLGPNKLIDVKEYSPSYEIFRFQNFLAINKNLDINTAPFLS